MKKKIISTLVCSILLVTTFTGSVYAAKAESRQEQFAIAKTSNYKEVVEERIDESMEDGYKAKNIELKILKDGNGKKIEKTYNNLNKKEVPEEIEEDGKKYKLKDVQYVDATVTYQKNYNNYVRTPNIPSTENFIKDNVEFTGELVDTTKTVSGTYNVPFSIPAKFYGDAETMLYEINGTEYDAANAPIFTGFNNVICDYLNIDTGMYNITNGEWSGDFYTDNEGRSVRNATFTGLQRSSTYTATYRANSYNATAVYEDLDANEEMVISATYDIEKDGLSTIEKIIIGACAFAIALAAVLIIYVISKKGKEKEEAK